MQHPFTMNFHSSSPLILQVPTLPLSGYTLVDAGQHHKQTFHCFNVASHFYLQWVDDSLQHKQKNIKQLQYSFVVQAQKAVSITASLQETIIVIIYILEDHPGIPDDPDFNQQCKVGHFLKSNGGNHLGELLQGMRNSVAHYIII